MNIRKFHFISILFIIFASCSTDSTSDLLESSNSSIVTYNSNIKNIIDLNCIACHGITPSNGATITLTSYNAVKSAVLTNGLIPRISSAEGQPNAMPFGGPR